MSTSEPLKARPMGLRAVATMTASGMAPPGMAAAAGRAGGDGQIGEGGDDTHGV
jgi:hypothetical protein